MSLQESVQEEEEEEEDEEEDEGERDGSVPAGQALLHHLLEQCFEIVEDLKRTSSC